MPIAIEEEVNEWYDREVTQAASLKVACFQRLIDRVQLSLL